MRLHVVGFIALVSVLAVVAACTPPSDEVPGEATTTTTTQPSTEPEHTYSTNLVSISHSGEEGDGTSFHSAVSADGRYVAFRSLADNLIEGEHIPFWNVYVRDQVTGIIELVSVHTNGTKSNLNAWGGPSISADGRYVAFQTFASNLVDGDTNGTGDIFVRDRLAGTTELISVHTDGTQGNAESQYPVISADGRYVAYHSYATTLVDGDENGHRDMFVRDRVLGTTSLVSVHTNGTQGNNESLRTPSISADGRYIVFESYASNLVDDDTNGVGDIFIRDQIAGTTERISLHTNGTQARHASLNPAISADGRFVTFYSAASDLVDGDSNGIGDVFIRDRIEGTTELVTVHTNGTQANLGSWGIAPMSADGRYVVFHSLASTLVDGDTNDLQDIFIRDRVARRTTRIMAHGDGTQIDNHALDPTISADGGAVSFHSPATNLIEGGTNGNQHVFISIRDPLLEP